MMVGSLARSVSRQLLSVVKENGPVMIRLSSSKVGLLERLATGPVVGDGSFVVTLEKRGYVQAGSWTPEASIQYPDAVKQLHREFLRAGADVMQTFTFYASDSTLEYRVGNNSTPEKVDYKELNRKACDLAREVADEGGALVAGGISPVQLFNDGGSREDVKKQFNNQMEVFIQKKVDFFLGEFFSDIREAEIAIEAMCGHGIPVACSMCIGPVGDLEGVSPGECAVRMAKAGADLVGINCNYDPFTCIEAIKIMKNALAAEGLSTFLMAQPVGWHAQEIKDNPKGYTELPEFPYAMEPRLLTRLDVHRFARAAFEAGVNYFGGCCGFEPYHIRAIAEELSPERGRRPPGKDKHIGWEGLQNSGFQTQKMRGNRKYWEGIIPAAGRTEIKFLADIAEA